MKLVTVIGTRPEIVKMSPLLEAFDKHFDHILLHSGQHYDPLLDKNLFEELNLNPPTIYLKTGSGNFAAQVTHQILAIYDVLKEEMPDYVLVQGDTNTALSAALVAARLKIKVIHLEAGCRSGNIESPEEQNRLMIDAIASIRLCSDKQAYKNLLKEGKKGGTFLTGSTTFDALARTSKISAKLNPSNLSAPKEKFILATLHRAENMQDMDAFLKKINYLNWLSTFIPVIFPIHPRTKQFLQDHKISLSRNVQVSGPVNHLTFTHLLKNCRFVVSDSGGVQEEAAYFDRPCLVLRTETEWMRLVKVKKNFLLRDLNSRDYRFSEKLISDQTFYQQTRKAKCPESNTGAVKNILNIMKNVSK